jgi:DNA-binding CsgD family transcriptional regulator
MPGVGTPVWPLVGREGALRLARAALAQGSGLVVTGPLGVGRSRLAAEVLAEAEAGGAPVVRLAVTRAAATIPFGAAAPLLAPADDVATGDPTGAAGGDTEGIVLAAHRAVAARAGDRPLLVGVDDAHLLDEATASLLTGLLEDGCVQLVLTVRTGDPVPEPVRALWYGRGWRLIDLGELSEADVGALLGEVLGGEVESATVARLWESTRGNALFLRELCRDALDAGALTSPHGVWTWAPAPFTGPRLHDLVAGRIGALTPAEHQVAALLALGEPLPVRLLDWLSDAEVVAGLRDRGLVSVERVDGRQVARLAHPLYADGVRARLGPLETADLYATLVRGTLAEAVTHVAGPLDPARLDPDERLRLAVWSISGTVDADPALLAAAAADARAHDEPALAERLARAALGQSPSTGIARPPAPVPPPCSVSFAAALTLGEALGELGRPGEAEVVLAPLVDVAHDDTDRARVAAARLAALRLLPAAAGRARAVAAAAGVDEPEARDVVQAALADALSHLGELDEGGRMACELLEHGAPAARFRAVAPATFWLTLVGKPETALGVVATALAGPAPATPAGAPQRAPGSGTRGLAAAGVLGLVGSGRVAEAEAAVSRAVDDPGRHRHIYAGTLALMRGRIALSRGRPATARRALGEAAVVLGRADQLGRRAWALTLLAEAQALLGDVDGARASLAARPARGQSHRYRRDIQRSEVWVTVATGDDGAAQAMALADDAADAGHIGYELAFLDLALRLGAEGAAVRALAITPRVEGPFARVTAGLCRALPAGDGAGLTDAADGYAALGLDLHAAETAFLAAAAHRRAGNVRGASVADDRAHSLAAACEGARTPGLAGGSAVGSLTPREREVALLAGQGMASRLIAERLDVSVRTVDNQLGSAYRKLGVASRAELAALLGGG